MARKPREDAPGCVHHVWIRGVEKRPIFRDDEDRTDLLARLARVVPEGGGYCYAWAFMPNHVHYVLRTGNVPLSRVMQRINTGYAMIFNRRHERSGYLFQGRFGSRRAVDDAGLVGLVRYVHANPVEAGLTSPDDLARFRWSGHGALVGARPAYPFEAPDQTLSLFDEDPVQARAAVANWMGAVPPPPRVASVRCPAGKAPVACDEEARGDQDIDAIVEAVARRYGLSQRAILGRSKRADHVAARSEICRRASESGWNGERIARALSISPHAVSRALARVAGTPRGANHPKIANR